MADEVNSTPYRTEDEVLREVNRLYPEAQVSTISEAWRLCSREEVGYGALLAKRLNDAAYPTPKSCTLSKKFMTELRLDMELRQDLEYYMTCDN